MSRVCDRLSYEYCIFIVLIIAVVACQVLAGTVPSTNDNRTDGPPASSTGDPTDPPTDPPTEAIITETRKPDLVIPEEDPKKINATNSGGWGIIGSIFDKDKINAKFDPTDDLATDGVTQKPKRVHNVYMVYRFNGGSTTTCSHFVMFFTGLLLLFVITMA